MKISKNHSRINYFSLYKAICATIIERDGLPVWAEITEEARRRFPLIQFQSRKAEHKAA